MKKLITKLEPFLDKILGTKLRYRMLILYFCGGVLPAILIGGYLIQGTRNILVEQTKTVEVTELEMARRQLEEILTTVNMVSKYFFFDEELEKIAFEQYEDYQEMVDDYKAYTAFVDYGQYYNQLISRFTVYLENETIRGNSQFVKVNDAIREQKWYQNVLNKGGGALWQNVPSSMNADEGFALTRLLKTKRGKNVGVLVLHIQKERINDILRSREYDTFVALDKDQIISERIKSDIDLDNITKFLPEEDFDTYQDMVSVDGKKYILTSVGISPDESQDSLQIVSMRSLQKILQEANRQNQKSVYLFLLSIGLSCFMIAAFSWSFSERVARFHKEMRKAAEGNFQLEKKLGGNDEISELYDYLGTMIFEIQKLLSEIYQEKLHAERLKREQKEAEFKMLASQINPHFLYNTLEVIRMKARMNKQYEIEELVKMLAKILRKNIQAGSQDVSICTEAELVACYLRIQQYRFGDRIQYEIHVDPELEEHKILPLLLQPIVENSIIHGLEIKEGIGHIFINITQTDKRICIVIEDDGMGMTEETLQKIQRDMNRRNQDGTHIGIGNVHQRVRLRYGEAYGVKINSEWQKGTKVEIVLPKEENEKERGIEVVQGNGY
ncbi:MAG: histidine kinase [Eubacteriales bacterium]|nr:histidine kinase [Eubacteriales bacterium]